MAKLMVRSVLHNKSDDKFFSCESEAKHENNVLSFMDNDVSVVITFGVDSMTINRTSSEYDVELPLKYKNTTTGRYDIKALGSLDLKVKTTLFEVNDEVIRVNYSMIVDDSSVSDFEYTIELMEVDE